MVLQAIRRSAAATSASQLWRQIGPGSEASEDPE